MDTPRQTAIQDGYTQEYMAYSNDERSSMPIMVKPGQDMDSAFIAYDIEAEEYIRINGWNFYFDKETNNG